MLIIINRLLTFGTFTNQLCKYFNVWSSWAHFCQKKIVSFLYAFISTSDWGSTEWSDYSLEPYYSFLPYLRNISERVQIARRKRQMKIIWTFWWNGSCETVELVSFSLILFCSVIDLLTFGCSRHGILCTSTIKKYRKKLILIFLKVEWKCTTSFKTRISVTNSCCNSPSTIQKISNLVFS